MNEINDEIGGAGERKMLLQRSDVGAKIMFRPISISHLSDMNCLLSAVLLFGYDMRCIALIPSINLHTRKPPFFSYSPQSKVPLE